MKNIGMLPKYTQKRQNVKNIGMLPKCTQKMAKCEKYRNVTKIHANSLIIAAFRDHMFSKMSQGIGLRQDRTGAGTRC